MPYVVCARRYGQIEYFKAKEKWTEIVNDAKIFESKEKAQSQAEKVEGLTQEVCLMLWGSPSE